MSSILLNPQDKVEASASQRQLSKPRRDRKSSVAPTKASQLNDKAARRTEASLLGSFQRSARSITPPPGIDTSKWGKNESALILVNNLDQPKRHPGPAKSRNIVGPGGGNNRKVSVRMYVTSNSHEAASGVFSTMCDSGLFDEEIRRAHRKLNGESTSPKRKVEMQIHDAAEIPGHRQQSKSSRASANKPRTAEDVQNDPLIGATAETVSEDFLGQ